MALEAAGIESIPADDEKGPGLGLKLKVRGGIAASRQAAQISLSQLKPDIGERSAFSFRSLAPIHPYIMRSGVVPISVRSSTCRTRKSATSARLITPNRQSFDAVRTR